MFREMRRKNQLLSENDCVNILTRATSGTLALSGDNDYPYAVPMSYVFHNGKIYFHSALTGHKIDAINRHDKASFCVIDKDEVISGEFTTYFRSVIAFGNIRVIKDDTEKRHAIEILAEKYSPEFSEGRKNEIEDGFNHLCMIELDIVHMTGKEAIELVRMRDKTQTVKGE